MGVGPTFNLEVKFGGREDAIEFFEDELLPFIENNYEVTWTDVELTSPGCEFELPGTGEGIKVDYAENYMEYMGNLGNWPALVVAYQPYYDAEMPHAKRHIEALDEIRDFLIKRKPASDVKYYVSTRAI